MNKTILLGNITRDIELRYTPKGTAVTDIGLAINRRSKNSEGEVIEDTTFVDVTAWGRTAEVLNQYTTKGSQILVEGRLQTESWVDKDTGGNRSKLKVVAENIRLLGGKSDKPASSKPAQQPQATQPAPQHTEPGVDLPF